MVKAVLLFCFGCIATICFSQQRELDSLLLQLNKYPQEDTAKLSLLLNIALNYHDINPAKGMEVAITAVAMAKKMDNLKPLSAAYLYAAQNYQMLGQDSIAIAYCNKALSIKQQLKDSAGIANVYYTIGLSYYNQSDYYRAIENEEKALSIFVKLKDMMRQANIINSLGVDNMYIGNYPKALAYYQQAFAIGKAKGNEKLQANALTNIGLIYTHMADYSKALDYHYKALAIHQHLGNKTGISNCYGNIANVYDSQEDTSNARKYYKLNLQAATEAGYAYGIASALSNTGISYINAEAYSDAYPYLQNALQKFTALNDKTNMANMLDCLSLVYLNAPEATLKKHNLPVAGRLATAAQLQLKSIELSAQSHNLQELGAGYEYLSDIYKAQNNYAKAYEAYKQSVVYKDSLLNDDKKQQLTRLEAKFEFDKIQDSIKAVTDKQQALASAAIQKQQVINNTLLAGTIFIAVAGFAGFIFYKRNRDIKTQKNEAELKAQVAETEMKALRAQMNPHFIFNSLNSISDYIDKQENKTAATFTGKFARLMRMVLENSEQKEIPLTNDIKALELYMQLECLRTKNKFTYEINVSEEIDQENTLVPPLILQPFVENSIWHGIAKKQGEGHITIYIKKENEMLNCIIDDNGAGMQTATFINTEKKSLGMRITKDRIDMLNKQKNVHATMQVFSKEQGVRAEVNLPLQLSF